MGEQRETNVYVVHRDIQNVVNQMGNNVVHTIAEEKTLVAEARKNHTNYFNS